MTYSNLKEVNPLEKFNLLEESWIPVLKRGTVTEIGLAEALVQAHSIERIETPSPLEEAALHRLLLSVLHRALGGPRDVDGALDLLESGVFSKEKLEAYLDRYHKRFYLFHQQTPFLQIADLPEDPPPVPWVKLRPDLASGNNPTLFDHTTEASFPTASYGEAARALLVHQTFTTGGLLKRFKVTSAKGGPLAGAAAFLSTGKNLFETLLLNLVPYAPEDDFPVWEASPLRRTDVEGYQTAWPLSGTTRVYTWPARGVRLLDEGSGVRFMAYGPGVKPGEAYFRDPMVAYRQDKKGQMLPLRLSTERSFWRDFGAMLPAAGGAWPATLAHAEALLREQSLYFRDSIRHGLRVLGQVADQAKILDVRREVYPLPPGLLEATALSDLEVGLKRAEALGQGLRSLAWTVARGMLGEKDSKELSNFAASLPLERIFWAHLDGAFPGFMARLGQSGALKGWNESLARAALEAWEATRLFVGTGGRHLKALAEGEKRLGGLLREVRA
ncbi:type I-E CRISPR-associated protein Cse1/CasA [Marinithermus hydrothermalis]|uniref:CRISPR-associated protein, Cse1 family n=1 Tax=Marinithermus hydrothermalis (strain DSM 14884 / JCM 11576 / T1) TaxID=869210 RepID=F2NLA2_MARHT|nr:type I-E CRISPR-associated protein Cse1/CasA [Marinithermus hydrothermalis]AEB11721.1 CRISPR-associated protein, Cse1 family [Marinithermus hydrothermalis DSM 14884]